MSAVSPRKFGVGIVQNFIPLDAPESNVRSSRNAIKGELVHKLVYDDARVFDRYLGIDQVSTPLVDYCVAGFNAANEQAIEQLRKITDDAAPKPLDELEAPERDGEGVQRKAKREEKKMYPHLRSIFQYIEGFSLPHQHPPPYNRHFVETSSTTLTTEAHTWGFPNGSPDFSLLDMTPESMRYSKGSKGKVSTLWRHRSAFAEIKPTTKQGPMPSDRKTVLPIVTQCADYARLHLSASPFQLFSIGLMIFGFEFCVAIFDRDGIMFSPIRDMLKDKGVFIRVVRRLTCDLSPVELGQDPTVRMIGDVESIPWKEKAKAVAGTDKFPCFSITMGGNDHRQWFTLGPPIWTSISLLGRGTSIWRVCEATDPADVTQPVLVLKNAWRSSKRTAESDIYKSITDSHPGVASHYFGTDVMFPGIDNHTINVNNLRGDAPCDDEGTPILHRLLLKTIGRPLWEYSSDLEFLKGLRAALRGHQYLCERGILHRDVSAGNILLSADPQPSEGHEGFLTDLEFAHISVPSLTTVNTRTISVPSVRNPAGHLTEPTTRTHTKYSTVTVQRGAVMTGTAQFMAIGILQAIVERKTIVHQVHHDLESFVWVMCYSINRRLVLDSNRLSADERADLHKFFHGNFGRMDMDSIAVTRQALQPLRFPHRFPNLLSEPMTSLYDSLYDHLQLSVLRKDPVFLTHDVLLTEFDRIIHIISNTL